VRLFLFGASMTKRKIPVVVERTEICKNCRAVESTRAEGLRCHLMPPNFVYDPATGLSKVEWPEVPPDGWCIQFKAQLSS
jgi:hypothetical protein